MFQPLCPRKVFAHATTILTQGGMVAFNYGMDGTNVVLVGAIGFLAFFIIGILIYNQSFIAICFVFVCTSGLGVAYIISFIITGKYEILGSIVCIAYAVYLLELIMEIREEKRKP